MGKRFYSKFIHFNAKCIAALLSAVLFLCANTNSSCMFYQPKVPEALDQFRKFR